jgi:hypothetical protein
MSMQDPANPGVVVPLFGPFIYYDLFSWTGLSNYMWDQFFLITTFIPQVIIAAIRDGNQDWSFWQSWTANSVDKDNILPEIFPPDRFNKDYWTSIDTGIDCNGNVGMGNYCYCESQGYICTCSPESPSTTQKLNCFDHYGYDCAGNIVDGEDKWCQNTNSAYWLLNS